MLTKPVCPASHHFGGKWIPCTQPEGHVSDHYHRLPGGNITHTWPRVFRPEEVQKFQDWPACEICGNPLPVEESDKAFLCTTWDLCYCQYLHRFCKREVSDRGEVLDQSLVDDPKALDGPYYVTCPDCALLLQLKLTQVIEDLRRERGYPPESA